VQRTTSRVPHPAGREDGPEIREHLHRLRGDAARDERARRRIERDLPEHHTVPSEMTAWL
jgi:hypothetical protein